MMLGMKKAACSIFVTFVLVISFCCPYGCKGKGPGANYVPPGPILIPIEPSSPVCAFEGVRPDGSSQGVGVAPFFVVVLVDLDGNFPADHAGRPLISRVEIDFSDGTGWHDYTTETREFYNRERSWEDMPTYALTEPGKYPIHVRVTFVDGEVIDNEDIINYDHAIQTITVLPPDDGDGGA
jgi:hypothetical protein